MFGGGTAATSGSTGFGSGGFGGTNTASTGFGGSNTGGGLFGQQNKPAFGVGTTGTTGTGGMFGGGNTSSTTTSAFGAGGATAFGGGLNQQSANNGTAGTPFQAHVEKDGATSQNAHYQTITFQQPYQGSSLEELRLQDYAQGRRYGNANGQAGAFGASTGFGGFGSNNAPANTSGGFGSNNTSGGLFGAQNNNNTTATSSPFGGAQSNTTSSFGSNTGGGLFGANKPATGGGMFGNNTASTGQTSGGLFGTAGSTGTSAFGSGNTGGGFGANNNTAGGGLFGNNQQTQNKPAFGGGFGSGTSTGFGSSTAGTGFGANNNTSTGGGLFGNNNSSTPSAFGANNQQQPQQNTSNPFGGFGQNNQPQQQNQPAGGGLFGGGFGQNNQQNQQQNKPLFGGATTGTTGGGLFGGGQQQQQNQTGGGLFGNNTQQQNQAGGGLFGAKPAGTTGGLFGGATNTNTNTGGGLFGGLGQNQNQQQGQTGGGLFGAKPAGQTGGLFGGATNTNTNTGGGLFGGSLGQNNNTGSAGLGGGLFGASQQQNQQQQPALGGSLFGASTAQQSTNQSPQLTASMNGNPYGNEHLFASLNTPSQSVGPLATPLSSSQKQKKNAILPQHRINPAASSRLITPQKRLNGYGFSYSNYGTPGSAMSGGSPSFSGSLMSGGGSFSKSLSKSFSTSSLKNTWNAEDSILSPGAFNPSKRPAYANTGSMKKLNIDRALNVRPSLFGDDSTGSPASQKKRVSFDASTTLNGSLDSANGALVPADRESTTPTAEEQGFLRSSRNGEKPTNGAPVNGDKAPEMSQVKGNELAIVPDDNSSEADRILKITNEKARKAQRDQTPGKYWSEPSLDELKKMSKQELKSLENFRVGREGIGEIQFEVPVDLTAVNWDKLFGETIQLNVRNATVYPSKTSTPPVGKGMNVQSLITLENSWPRAQAGKNDKGGSRFQRHMERLKKVEGTDFVSYDPHTGKWQFRVYHYTTYGLDYDDDEDDSMLTDPPTDLQSPTPMARHAPAPLSALSRVPQEESTIVSLPESSPDDTFEFKRGLIRRTNVPGSFDDEDAYDDDYMEDGQDDTINSTQSFLDERSVGPYEDGSDMDDVASYRSGSDSEPEHTMAGSFPIPDLTTEQTPAKNNVFDASGMPKSILKASRTGFGTPTKGAFDFEGDWATQLQRTISPKKQDRQTLRENQNNALRQFDEKNDETPKAPSFNQSTNKPFSNSIDLMNSLFGQSTARRTATANGSPVKKRKGLEV